MLVQTQPNQTEANQGPPAKLEAQSALLSQQLRQALLALRRTQP